MPATLLDSLSVRDAVGAALQRAESATQCSFRVRERRTLQMLSEPHKAVSHRMAGHSEPVPVGAHTEHMGLTVYCKRF